jgi:hypothetical protein
MIEEKDLKDGYWYTGKGRNSNIGMWDKVAKCFWVICVNDFADPKKFPKNSKRRVRLKQEDYSKKKCGSFKPEQEISVVIAPQNRSS